MFDDRFSFPMQAALNLYTRPQTEDGQFPLYASVPQAAKAPDEASHAEKVSEDAQDADRKKGEKEGENRAEGAL